MSILLDMLSQNIGSQHIRQLGNAIGADEQTTDRLVSNALPLMLKAMSRNAQAPGGTDMLRNDLDRDSGGSILDNLDSFLNIPATSDDDNIVSNLFGGKRHQVEKGLGKLGGVDTSMASKLLPLLAPVVMSMLGKATRDQGVGRSGLADFLGQEEKSVEKKASGDLGMLGSLLDSDGDGQVIDDLAKIGGSLLSGLFGSKR